MRAPLAHKGVMNEQTKKLWLDALRSGDYKQGELQLRDQEGGYCCLGVLLDVASRNRIIKGGWELLYPNESYPSWRYTYPSEEYGWATDGLAREDVELPHEIGEELHIPSSIAVFLTQLNDGYDPADHLGEGGEEIKAHSFSEIADYIEENL